MQQSHSLKNYLLCLGFFLCQNWSTVHNVSFGGGAQLCPSNCLLVIFPDKQFWFVLIEALFDISCVTFLLVLHGYLISIAILIICIYPHDLSILHIWLSLLGVAISMHNSVYTIIKYVGFKKTHLLVSQNKRYVSFLKCYIYFWAMVAQWSEVWPTSPEDTGLVPGASTVDLLLSSLFTKE